MTRRRIGVAAIIAYTSVVIMAAWRHEIRPPLFDPPAALCRAVLGWFGVPGGVAVFTSNAGVSPDEKITVQCFEVRVDGGSGSAHRLYPDAHRVCPTPEPRIWIRGEDIALYRLAMGLRSAIASHRAGALPRSRVSYPRLLAESMAEHFRRRAAADALSPDRYALLWTESRIDYATGAESNKTVALLRWREDREQGVFVSWRPDADTLARHWPPLSGS